MILICFTHKVLIHKLQLVLLAFLVRELVLVRGALARMKVAVALPVPPLPVPVTSHTFRMASLVMVAVLGATWRAMPAGCFLPARATSQPTLTSFGHPWVHWVMPQQQGGLLPSITLNTHTPTDLPQVRHKTKQHSSKSVTCRSTQGAVVEEAIGRIVTTAAHSGSAVFVEVGLALFLKVGSRGLEERVSMVRIWLATEP